MSITATIAVVVLQFGLTSQSLAGWQHCLSVSTYIFLNCDFQKMIILLWVISCAKVDDSSKNVWSNSATIMWHQNIVQINGILMIPALFRV